MGQQQRKRVIPKVRRNRLVRGPKLKLPLGVREILETIVNNMGGCRDEDGGPCKGHMVMFNPDDLAVAKAALAASTK